MVPRWAFRLVGGGNTGSTAAALRPIVQTSLSSCEIELLDVFELSLKLVALGNKRAHGTRQRPPTVHLQARNHLADDIRRACLDFAWKFFGDVRVRQVVGLSLIAPNALGDAAAVYLTSPCSH